jgi:hypothetical protein
MMTIITEYKIISDSDINELVSSVNQLITEDNFQPLGSAFSTNIDGKIYFHQTMVKNVVIRPSAWDFGASDSGCHQAQGTNLQSWRRCKEWLHPFAWAQAGRLTIRRPVRRPPDPPLHQGEVAGWRRGQNGLKPAVAVGGWKKFAKPALNNGNAVGLLVPSADSINPAIQANSAKPFSAWTISEAERRH